MNQYRVRLNGLDLAALASNSGCSGVPVICLHGWLDNAASFIPLVEQLKPESPCYLLDWPGHGLSGNLPEGAHYHFVDWVDWLHRFIHHIQADKVILIGHSMGAMVASMYAAAFPNVVEKLVMIEGVGPLSFPAGNFVENLRKSLKERTALVNKAKSNYGSFDEAVEARLRAGGMTHQSASLLAERGCSSSDEKWLWCYDYRLKAASAQRLNEEQVVAIIREITSPVLLLLGGRGFPEIKALLKQRQQHFSDISIKTVPGGHHLHMDSPQAVVSSIKTFLTQA